MCWNRRTCKSYVSSVIQSSSCGVKLVSNVVARELQHFILSCFHCVSTRSENLAFPIPLLLFFPICEMISLKFPLLGPQMRSLVEWKIGFQCILCILTLLFWFGSSLCTPLILLLVSVSSLCSEYSIICSIKIEQFPLRILKMVCDFQKVTAQISLSVSHANCHPVAAYQSTSYFSQTGSTQMPRDS